MSKSQTSGRTGIVRCSAGPRYLLPARSHIALNSNWLRIKGSPANFRHDARVAEGMERGSIHCSVLSSPSPSPPSRSNSSSPWSGPRLPLLASTPGFGSSPSCESFESFVPLRSSASSGRDGLRIEGLRFLGSGGGLPSCSAHWISPSASACSFSAAVAMSPSATLFPALPLSTLPSPWKWWISFQPPRCRARFQSSPVGRTISCFSLVTIRSMVGDWRSSASPPPSRC
mmetsp:Transcript_4731/g.13829  ORF Transcript_4731/g.13829 Transcript_4731/m.13829 type:complete len:229 (+) Transcript_4731:104-790(+)